MLTRHALQFLHDSMLSEDDLKALHLFLGPVDARVL